LGEIRRDEKWYNIEGGAAKAQTVIVP